MSSNNWFAGEYHEIQIASLQLQKIDKMLTSKTLPARYLEEYLKKRERQQQQERESTRILSTRERAEVQFILDDYMMFTTEMPSNEELKFHENSRGCVCPPPLTQLNANRFIKSCQKSCNDASNNMPEQNAAPETVNEAPQQADSQTVDDNEWMQYLDMGNVNAFFTNNQQVPTIDEILAPIHPDRFKHPSTSTVTSSSSVDQSSAAAACDEPMEDQTVAVIDCTESMPIQIETAEPTSMNDEKAVGVAEEIPSAHQKIETPVLCLPIRGDVDEPVAKFNVQTVENGQFILARVKQNGSADSNTEDVEIEVVDTTPQQPIKMTATTTKHPQTLKKRILAGIRAESQLKIASKTCAIATTETSPIDVIEISSGSDDEIKVQPKPATVSTQYVVKKAAAAATPKSKPKIEILEDIKLPTLAPISNSHLTSADFMSTPPNVKAGKENINARIIYTQPPLKRLSPLSSSNLQARKVIFSEPRVNKSMQKTIMSPTLVMASLQSQSLVNIPDSAGKKVTCSKTVEIDEDDEMPEKQADKKLLIENPQNPFLVKRILANKKVNVSESIEADEDEKMKEEENLNEMPQTEDRDAPIVQTINEPIVVVDEPTPDLKAEEMDNQLEEDNNDDDVIEVDPNTGKAIDFACPTVRSAAQRASESFSSKFECEYCRKPYMMEHWFKIHVSKCPKKAIIKEEKQEEEKPAVVISQLPLTRYKFFCLYCDHKYILQTNFIKHQQICPTQQASVVAEKMEEDDKSAVVVNQLPTVDAVEQSEIQVASVTNQLQGFTIAYLNESEGAGSSSQIDEAMDCNSALTNATFNADDSNNLNDSPASTSSVSQSASVQQGKLQCPKCSKTYILNFAFKKHIESCGNSEKRVISVGDLQTQTTLSPRIAKLTAAGTIKKMSQSNTRKRRSQ